jgi:hypothetical protein
MKNIALRYGHISNLTSGVCRHTGWGCGTVEEGVKFGKLNLLSAFYKIKLVVLNCVMASVLAIRHKVRGLNATEGDGF